MGKIFIAYSSGDGFKAATTKVGLAKEIGVSYDTVRRMLNGHDGNSIIVLKHSSWRIARVELVKVGGKRGKVVGGVVKGGSGFLGMKGKDGLKKGIE
jgi:hypothetical protein